MERPATPIFGTAWHASHEFPCAPEVEVFERHHILTVRLNIAGIKKEEISVTAANSFLTIEGKIGCGAEKRTYRFMRGVQLPVGVRATEITATFEDCVLEVDIPLPARAAAITPCNVTIGRVH